MNKPVIIIIIAVVIIGAGVGIYFFTKDTETTNTNQASVVTNTNQARTVTNINETNEETTEQNTFEGDDFTILSPPGWTQSQMQGTLVSFHKSDEVYPEGSAAKKINFKSYLAVSFDVTTTPMTVKEVNDFLVDQIKASIPSAKVIEENDEKIGGQSGIFNVITITQQEVDYTVFLAVILKGDKYYTVSGNTTTDRWSEYKDLFYQTARSFTFKTIE